MSTYYRLIKPGIVRGNLITAFAGAMLASVSSFDVLVIISMLIGLGSVIASGCVFNNVIDRDIDKKMTRTEKRALVTGEVTVKSALVFGSILLVFGVSTLYLFTNLLAVIVALVGFVAYVIVYGYYKRRSIYGTEVGSISGATPPVVGYLSVAGSVDLAALLLFLILVIWQMPHFFAIGIFRAKEYKNANLPIRSVIKGRESSVKIIQIYVLIFLFAAPSLWFFDYTGWTYLLGVSLAAIYWLYYGRKNIAKTDSVKWAKGMFGISLVVLLVFSALLSLNKWLP